MQFEKKLERKLEEDMIAKFEKYADEALRRAKPELRKIKNEKKRNIEETRLLWDATTTAELEYEQELEEERVAQERLAAYEETARKRD